MRFILLIKYCIFPYTDTAVENVAVQPKSNLLSAATNAVKSIIKNPLVQPGFKMPKAPNTSGVANNDEMVQAAKIKPERRSSRLSTMSLASEIVVGMLI